MCPFIPNRFDREHPTCDASFTPDRSSKRTKRPKDANQLAKSIVDEAPAQRTDAPEPEQTDDAKNPLAVALGRLGGMKGGKARPAKLTKEQARDCPESRCGPLVGQVEDEEVSYRAFLRKSSESVSASSSSKSSSKLKQI